MPLVVRANGSGPATEQTEAILHGLRTFGAFYTEFTGRFAVSLGLHSTVRTREEADRRKVTLRSSAAIGGPAREFFGRFADGFSAGELLLDD